MKCYTFCQFMIEIALLHGSLVGLTLISVDLEQHRFELCRSTKYILSTAQSGWFNLQLVESMDMEPQMFSTAWKGPVPLTPILFKVSHSISMANQFIWPLCSVDLLKVEQLFPYFLGATVNRRLFWVILFEIKDVIYVNHSTFNLSDAK